MWSNRNRTSRVKKLTPFIYPHLFQLLGDSRNKVSRFSAFYVPLLFTNSQKTSQWSCLARNPIHSLQSICIFTEAKSRLSYVFDNVITNKIISLSRENTFFCNYKIPNLEWLAVSMLPFSSIICNGSGQMPSTGHWWKWQQTCIKTTSLTAAGSTSLK